MTVSELLPTLSEWKREDKLRLMKHLESELARDENASPGDEIYPIWPPAEDFEAEQALLTALADHKALRQS